jgi:hypothetical protein
VKPRHASTAVAVATVIAASAFVALATFGCAHPQNRNDWRTPAQQREAAPGATGDGGAPGPGLTPGPAPSVQPSPNDIQI